MNKKIKSHLTNYCKKNGVSASTETFWDILSEDEVEIYRGAPAKHRWFNEVFKVAEVDGLEIGFFDAETTGDMSPYDIGWEYDPDDWCLVERHEETKVVVTYSKLKED